MAHKYWKECLEVTDAFAEEVSKGIYTPIAFTLAERIDLLQKAYSLPGREYHCVHVARTLIKSDGGFKSVHQMRRAMLVKLENKPMRLSWRQDTYEYLIARLKDEYEEWLGATDNGAVLMEAADICNFCMFIWDKQRSEGEVK